MVEDDLTKCPLCGYDFIPSIDAQCKWCKAGYRKLGNLPLGWVYQSEWEEFDERILFFRRRPFKLIPKAIEYFYKTLEMFREKKQNLNEEKTLRKHIALWGPSNSGKTWLLHAFLKKIAMYSINDTGHRFVFDLIDIATNKDIRSEGGPPVTGTQGIEEMRYLFRKKLKKDNNSVGNTQISGLREEVNTHVHELLVVDDRGQNQMPLTNIDKTGQNLRSEQDYISLSKAARADILLLLVDLDVIEKKEDFRDFIDGLTGFIDTLRELEYDDGFSLDDKRYLAVCLPKIDKYDGLRLAWLENDKEDKERKQKFCEVIEAFGGRNRADLISDKISDLESFGYKVGYFFISSCGYDGNNDANFDQATGQIADLAQWEPAGVEAPFFWAFDIIERARISNLTNHLLFQKIVKKDGIDVCSRREEQYIPYASISRMKARSKR